MSNLGAKHWQGIMRVLKYVRFTRDYGLHYIQDILLYLKVIVMQTRYQM